MPGSLCVVGTGIRAIAQTSPEAVACIERAQKVYFVLGDPLARHWLRQHNPTAESLMNLYAPGKHRMLTYRAVVDRVLTKVRSGLEVCMVTTGHPGVSSYAAQEMVRLARAEGYPARMLPGISAEDCLFADLGVDPADGCQSYEATGFLLCRPPVDRHSSLVLWQIGAVAEPGYQRRVEAWNPHGVAVLADVLAETYGAEHEVTVYEAARYAFVEPSTRRVTLGRLHAAPVSVLSTLYVPRTSPRPVDPARVRLLRRH